MATKKPKTTAGKGKPAQQTDDDKAHQLEIAAVKDWTKKIETTLDRNEDQYRIFTRMRRYVSGKALKKFKVKTNLIKSTVATLVPHIYARDPEVNIRPSEAVSPDRYAIFKKLARTSEIVVQREFLDGHLKRQGKRTVRSGITNGLGWIKVGTQTATGPDPIVQTKLDDTRQQIKRLEYLMEQASEDQDLTQQEADRAKLVDLVSVLESQPDVTVTTGMTYDFERAENIVVLGDINELIDYREAPAIAHRIWYTADKAQEEFGLTAEQVGKATTFDSRQVKDPKADKDEDDEDSTSGKAGDAPKKYVAAWEIWSRDEQTIYTMLQGYDCWVRAPYTPDPVGKRFYSFFLLAFHYLDGEFWPGIDVEDWTDLQDEYCATRSSFATHRRRAIPARIADASAFKSEADAKKVNEPESNELLLVENPVPGTPIENVVGISKYPPIDAALYDTAPIRNDIMLVSGVQDADRGAVMTAKTATEAEIQESGNTNRLSDRTDSIEDWLQEIAKYTLELALQVFSEEDVKRIAGPDAVWPKMSKDDIYRMLDVEIKAGSTGKPNRLAEQQTWAVLLPQTQQMALQIAQYRAKALQVMTTGDATTAQMLEAIANSLEALLRETYRRADERLDPDEFIPQMPKLPTPAAQAQPQPQPGENNADQGAAEAGAILGGPGVTVVPAGPQRGVQPGDQNTGNLGAP